MRLEGAIFAARKKTPPVLRSNRFARVKTITHSHTHTHTHREREKERERKGEGEISMLQAVSKQLERPYSP